MASAGTKRSAAEAASTDEAPAFAANFLEYINQTCVIYLRLCTQPCGEASAGKTPAVSYIHVLTTQPTRSRP